MSPDNEAFLSLAAPTDVPNPSIPRPGFINADLYSHIHNLRRYFKEEKERGPGFFREWHVSILEELRICCETYAKLQRIKDKADNEFGGNPDVASDTDWVLTEDWWKNFNPKTGEFMRTYVNRESGQIVMVPYGEDVSDYFKNIF